MTEYWKSNPMHWCDLCRCWMNDSKQAKANHERGTQHQAALAKKLRDMSKKADAEKSAKAEAVRSMESIEAAAKAQFEKDTAAAAAATGKWGWDEASGYYYQEKHRWYYDPKTGWYYGGEPVAWTQAPSLPAACMFGVAPHEGGPLAGRPAAPAPDAPGARSATGAGAGPSGRPTGAAAGGAGGSSLAESGVKTTAGTKTVVAVPQHPLLLNQIGGHQMPTAGRISGAKGTGSADAADLKRKREGGSEGAGAGRGKKPVSAAEAEAQARREAARQRVQQRTMTTFGLT